MLAVACAPAVFDPYLKKAVRCSGVPLSALVAAFARPGTDRVRIFAVDEYVVTFSRDDLQAGAFMLATRIDGEPMIRAMGDPVKTVLRSRDPDKRYVQKRIWTINRIEFLSD